MPLNLFREVKGQPILPSIFIPSPCYPVRNTVLRRHLGSSQSRVLSSSHPPLPDILFLFSSLCSSCFCSCLWSLFCTSRASLGQLSDLFCLRLARSFGSCSGWVVTPDTSLSSLRFSGSVGSLCLDCVPLRPGGRLGGPLPGVARVVGPLPGPAGIANFPIQGQPTWTRHLSDLVLFSRLSLCALGLSRCS